MIRKDLIQGARGNADLSLNGEEVSKRILRQSSVVGGESARAVGVPGEEEPHFIGLDIGCHCLVSDYCLGKRPVGLIRKAQTLVNHTAAEVACSYDVARSDTRPEMMTRVSWPQSGTWRAARQTLGNCPASRPVLWQPRPCRAGSRAGERASEGRSARAGDPAVGGGGLGGGSSCRGWT